MRTQRILIAVFVLSASAAAPAAPSRVDAEKDIYRAKCIGCHAIACNRSGPKLGGVVGRKAADVADFRGYTDALRQSGLVWTEQALDAYLRDPDKLVPGTQMASAGRIESAQQRKMLINFLKRGDTSLDLCF